MYTAFKLNWYFDMFTKNNNIMTVNYKVLIEIFIFKCLGLYHWAKMHACSIPVAGCTQLCLDQLWFQALFFKEILTEIFCIRR